MNYEALAGIFLGIALCTIAAYVFYEAWRSAKAGREAEEAHRRWKETEGE